MAAARADARRGAGIEVYAYVTLRRVLADIPRGVGVCHQRRVEQIRDGDIDAAVGETHVHAAEGMRAYIHMRAERKVEA
jgi:hypothetical protein